MVIDNKLQGPPSVVYIALLMTLDNDDVVSYGVDLLNGLLDIVRRREVLVCHFIPTS